MDKFSFITLWDAYSKLLTPTRQEITDMYFNLDLTVSEIAAEKGVSRQAVSDCLKGCKHQLEEYEEKLGVCARMRAVMLECASALTKADEWAEEFKSAHPEFTEEINKLVNILDKEAEWEHSHHYPKD